MIINIALQVEMTEQQVIDWADEYHLKRENVPSDVASYILNDLLLVSNLAQEVERFDLEMTGVQPTCTRS